MGYDGPTSGFDYAGDATRVFSDYSALNAGTEAITSTSSSEAATVDVAASVGEAATAAGALPTEAALTTGATAGIPVAAAAAASFLVGYAIGTGAKWLVGKLYSGITGSSRNALSTPQLFPAGDNRLQFQVYCGWQCGWNWLKSIPTSELDQVGLDFRTMASEVSPALTHSVTNGNETYSLPQTRFKRGGLMAASAVPSGYRSINPVVSVPTRSLIASAIEGYSTRNPPRPRPDGWNMSSIRAVAPTQQVRRWWFQACGRMRARRATGSARRASA
ncbi:MAG: hypothetical protein M3296_09405 [Actinomycetota bacterium]|nr:hypothetical protein [Actinomycetota bacterium]